MWIPADPNPELPIEIDCSKSAAIWLHSSSRCSTLSAPIQVEICRSVRIRKRLGDEGVHITQANAEIARLVPCLAAS